MDIKELDVIKHDLINRVNPNIKKFQEERDKAVGLDKVPAALKPVPLFVKYITDELNQILTNYDYTENSKSEVIDYLKPTIENLCRDLIVGNRK